MIYQRCAEARRHELLSERDISAMFHTHAYIHLPRIIHGGLIFYFDQIALIMDIYKIPAGLRREKSMLDG